MKYLQEKYREKNTLKSVLIIISIVFVLVFSVSKYLDHKRIDTLENSVMAIDNNTGIIFNLSREDYSINHRIAEYENHTDQFLRFWYQFDQNTFLENIEKAKNYIAIEDYERLLNTYKSERYLERIQSDDIILRISIDSIEVVYKDGIYVGVFKFTQFYRSQKFPKEKARNIEGEFKIFDIEERTYLNAHGATIYDFNLTQRNNL